MDYKKAAPVVVMMIVLVGLAGHTIATQMIASGLSYNPQFLGKHAIMDEGLGVPLYFPWRVYTWSASYHGGHIDSLLNKSLAISVGSIPAGGLVGGLIARNLLADKTSTEHGSARWATDAEIQKSGITLTPDQRYQALKKLKQANALGRLILKLSKQYNRPTDSFYATSSVVIGKDKNNNHFYDWGSEHVMVFAPTRSGKGVGIIIPTLLTWTGSVVITDIKGENYAITSEYRARFSDVYYYNPTKYSTIRYNPLMEIRPGDDAIRDVGNLVEVLVDGDDSGVFWKQGGKNILKATILYVLYACKDKTLGKVCELLYDEETLLDAMLATEFRNEHIRKLVHGVATMVKGKDDKIRGGWFANAQMALDLWSDPKVANATSASDFRIRDLQYGERPVSLYLVIPAGDVVRLSPLIRILFTQMIDILANDDVQASEDACRLLMLCDEFPNVGKIPKAEQSMSYTAGYGIKWMVICQGLEQFDQVYGRFNTFLMNCRVRLAYPCNDEKTAKRLSDLLGVGTYKKTQKGKSGKNQPLAGMLNKSESEVVYQRHLMTPDELMSLDENRIMVMRTGHRPILGHRVTYYDDPVFMHKAANSDFPTERDEDRPEAPNDWQNTTSIKRKANDDAIYDAPAPSTPEASVQVADAPTQTPKPSRDILQVKTTELTADEVRLIQEKLERLQSTGKPTPLKIEAPIEEKEALPVIEAVNDPFLPSFLEADEDTYQGKENIATEALSQDFIDQVVSQDHKTGHNDEEQ